jgi:hypothetical protein
MLGPVEFQAYSDNESFPTPLFCTLESMPPWSMSNIVHALFAISRAHLIPRFEAGIGEVCELQHSCPSGSMVSSLPHHSLGPNRPRPT